MPDILIWIIAALVVAVMLAGYVWESLRMRRWAREAQAQAHQAEADLKAAQHEAKISAGVERNLAMQLPVWAPPVEVADIAEQTLEHCRKRVRRSQPEWSETAVEYLARQLALDNLNARAEFRREIQEYTNPQ